jgi:hypothetical protein
LDEENTKLSKTLKRTWQEIKYWKAAMQELMTEKD